MMPRTRKPELAIGVACIALLASLFVVTTRAQQPAVAIDADDIGGVVTSTNGPEAGVWVIAETRELPVRYIKSVVTDDRGRFVVPDLPKATYTLWVRGYGLVDGPKATSAPGKMVNLTATMAPNDAAAAQYYPAIYWFSMLKIPSAADFGGEGRIPKGITQTAWLNQMKNNGCVGCHQLGQRATRTIPEAFGKFPNAAAAWLRRVSSGQSGMQMTQQLLSLGPLGAQMLGDWTDRVAKGELPRTHPDRPQGIERNIVITLQELGDDKHYLHDIIATDKRKPTVNANGPLYGSPEYSTDDLPVLDPIKHVATTFHATVLDPKMPLSLGPGHAAGLMPMAPSAYWADEQIWDTRVNNHNSMVDAKGRVWLAASTRGRENPAYCLPGSTLPSARVFPIKESSRQAAVWDPKTGKYSPLNTCFETHHPQFGFDANETVWFSGGINVLGWINTKMYDQTGDIVKSQGWTPFVLDTNGNGKRDAYVEPDQPVDPAKDKRMNVGF